MRSCAWLLIALGALGCTGKADVEEDFSDLAGMSAKSDYFSYRLKLLGTMTDGQSSTVVYTKTPRFRGFTLPSSEGVKVDAWVRSTDGGDALAWILDEKFNVIVKNDDADDSTYDSHLQATLPASKTGTYYLVFRDYNVHKHTFTVSLTETGGTPTTPAAPDTGSTTQAKAFVPLYTAAAGAFASNSHVVARTSVPVGVGSAASDFDGILTPTDAVTVWKFKAGSANAYAVIADLSKSSDSVYVSLFNSSGTWVAHGRNVTFASSPALDWGLDIDDPSICRCGLAPDGSGYAGCEWPDGVNRVSDISDCD